MMRDLQPDSLLFVPLGGAGEIGRNLNLYGHRGEWMMVDFGLSFADETLPGAEIVLPDPAFVEGLIERGERLSGLVLTHAHEDHLGAVSYLWRRLNCPITCTAFTAAVLRAKLRDAGLTGVPVRIVKPGEEFEVGPFRCHFIHVTHSIPEANALAIRTPLGNVLHSGDWKLDPEPLIGAPTAEKALAAFGREGVLALVSDSTNVFEHGTAGSEAAVRESLHDLVARQPGRVALTTFASNIARLETGMKVALATGRGVAVVGRSMRRMIDAAREAGYLKDMPDLVSEREVHMMPRERLLLLCTGSQGEPRSTMARIAARAHPMVELEPGDTVIFSSKIIPGNERTLYGLHNLLLQGGIEVITEEDHFVHVSGHPCRDEMAQLYEWIRPRISVPVHGEVRHLHEHAALARKLGVEQTVQVVDGDVLRLAPGAPEVVDRVHAGRLVVENGSLLEAGDELFRARRRLMGNGVVVVGVVMDPYGSVLAPPQLSVIGATDLESAPGLRAQAVEAVEDAIEALEDSAAAEDERVREAVRAAVRRGLRLNRDRRPIIEVQVTRLTSESLAALEEQEAGAAE
ncbi:MAG TPA: ribonuclease J [Geminicoccaceae bacterium]|nr:ribonuclease J [Geminicoccaceae bacterium]